VAEREFLIYLDPETRLCRYRHYHISKRKKIVVFRIQLEIFVRDEWDAVVRYDTAHGKAHRDVLHPNGSQSKDWFEDYTIEEVLTIGQKDILENWSAYRDRFVQEIKE
jgi:hypothetical protein